MKVLFVHGAGNTGATWRAQIPAFPGAEAVDLPGHPGGPSCPTVEDYSDWLKGFIDQRGYQKVILIGHSMGGAITLSHALRYSQQLKAIGLIGTGARLRINPVIFETLAEDYEKAKEVALDFVMGPEATPEQREEWRQQKADIRREVAEGDYRACDRFDVMERVDEIKLPTLIVCGSEDKLTPVKYSQFLHDRIKGSQLHVVPRAGHALLLEKAEEFNRILSEFLTHLGREVSN